MLAVVVQGFCLMLIVHWLFRLVIKNGGVCGINENNLLWIALSVVVFGELIQITNGVSLEQVVTGMVFHPVFVMLAWANSHEKSLFEKFLP